MMGVKEMSGWGGRWQNLRLQLALETGKHIHLDNYMHESVSEGCKLEGEALVLVF